MTQNERIFNAIDNLTKKNIVRESRDTAKPNIRLKLYLEALRGLADARHGSFKRGKITCAKSESLALIISDMLKVFKSCRWIKEIAHLRRARASRRTSSAGMR